MKITRLFRWTFFKRFWHPKTFPRFFQDVQTVFPNYQVTFYHAQRLPRTIFGQPQSLTPLTLERDSDHTINFFRVTLQDGMWLESWGTPLREHIAIREQQDSSLSPSIQDITHPDHEGMTWLLHQAHLITFGRFFVYLLGFLLLFQLPFNFLFLLNPPLLYTFPLPQLLLGLRTYLS